MNTYSFMPRSLFDLSLTLMFALMVIPNIIRPSIVGVFVAVMIYESVKRGAGFNLRRFLWDGSFYIVLVISLMYTSNLGYGFQKLGTMSPLLIFPIGFAFFPQALISQAFDNLKKYQQIYIIAVVLLTVGQFAYYFPHYKWTLLTHYPALVMKGLYRQHPLYLSTHIGLAILFSWFLIKSERNSKIVLFYCVLDAILLFFMFILLKKGPIITLFLLATLFLLLHKNKRILKLYLASIGLVVCAILVVPKLMDKFEQLSHIETIGSGHINSVNIRYTIYGEAIKLIRHAPFFGYGVGDAKERLIKEYKPLSDMLYAKRYNSHDQYLGIILMVGGLGLIVFLGYLSYHFVLGIRYGNHILIFTILIYGMFMLFENMLEREDGVIFFAFFVGFYSIFNGQTANQIE